MRSLRLPIAALLMTVAMTAAACGGKKQVQTPPPAPPAAPAPTPTPPPTAAAATATACPIPDAAANRRGALRADDLDELNAKGVLADVLFGYDSTELTARTRAGRCRRTPTT